MAIEHNSFIKPGELENIKYSKHKEDSKPKKNRITVNIGEELFEFHSFSQWVNKASSWFKGVRKPYICIDSLGRICFIGEQFMRARDESAFPITVYRSTI